jgi:hypothetical protein
VSRASILQQAIEEAKALAASGLYNGRTAASLVPSILVGYRFGLDATTAVSNITVEKGKVTFSASFQLSLLAASPKHDYRVVESNDKICRIEFLRTKNGIEITSVGQAEFNIKEAEKAKLTKKDVWNYYASDLLFARCATRGIRRYAPDLLMGNAAYTREELGADIGEAIRKIGISHGPIVLPADKLIAMGAVEVPSTIAPAVSSATCILAPVPPAQQQNTKPDDRPGGPGKATIAQIADIRRVKEALKIPADAWKTILAKRNVASAVQLEEAEADKLIVALRGKIVAQQLAEGSASASPATETVSHRADLAAEQAQREATAAAATTFPVATSNS